MDQEMILEVNNLSVTLDSENILYDISFGVKRGEALAIIGPNGAGKTVLFRALLGLIPYSGKVHWKEGIKIGYAPQKLTIDKLMPLSVEEFFLLKSDRFWFPRNEFLDHIHHELDVVGLPVAILRKSIGEISGGELQRILISWAIMNHPDVLLFDEPTAGIDVGFEETIYTLLHRLQDERGTAILLISHDLEVVYRYAERVLCINKKMICHGKPREVLSPQELTKLYGEGGFYHHFNGMAH